MVRLRVWKAANTVQNGAPTFEGLDDTFDERIPHALAPNLDSMLAQLERALDSVPVPISAPIVRMLQDAGAILHCKTTVPAALIAIETESDVFGRTTNPYNRSLTSGGSSGGEGALIALKGSPLGVGSDIGGCVARTVPIPATPLH